MTKYLEMDLKDTDIFQEIRLVLERNLNGEMTMQFVDKEEKVLHTSNDVSKIHQLDSNHMSLFHGSFLQNPRIELIRFEGNQIIKISEDCRFWKVCKSSIWVCQDEGQCKLYNQTNQKSLKVPMCTGVIMANDEEFLFLYETEVYVTGKVEKHTLAVGVNTNSMKPISIFDYETKDLGTLVSGEEAIAFMGNQTNLTIDEAILFCSIYYHIQKISDKYQKEEQPLLRVLEQKQAN